MRASTLSFVPGWRTFSLLEILTFTGVDDQTDLDRLRDLNVMNPFVEWGVLVGTGSTDGRSAKNPIFPTLDRVRELALLGIDGGLRTSLHLCGNWSRSALNRGGTKAIDRDVVLDLCQGFSRVQLNLHGDFFNDEWIPALPEDVVEFAEEVTCTKVILQHRSGWQEVPVRHPKVEYLWDQSEGRGLYSLRDWPAPESLEQRTGYAGGLNLGNIRKAMAWVKWFPHHRLWLDMESGVRTNGIFNLNSVELIVKQVRAAR